MIKPGDRVLVSGSVRDAALLEDLALESMKLGGQPLITIGSDRLTRHSYDDVPAQFDSAPATLGMTVANGFDVALAIDVGESDSVLAGVPAARIAARAKAGIPVGQAILKRNVRTISLGNGLYPTAQTASRLGIPIATLSEMFWRSAAVAPATMHAKGDAARAALAAGKLVTISAANGTNITFATEAAKGFISDGALSPAQIKQGGAATVTWLPAGELLVPLALGTAEGKVVIDKYVYQGTIITGLTLTYAKGKLTGMTATSGIEALKSVYDASSGGKDALSYVDLGLNPEVKLPLNTGRIVWMAAGAVTLGWGDNTGWGGMNVSDFALPLPIPSATVAIDGKQIVENGVLK
jgi:aminopeptidase